MDRARMLQEAIEDGLESLGDKERRDLIQATWFELRIRSNGLEQVVAHCPRPRLSKDRPASPEHVDILRDAIEEGLRVNGYMDVVLIEP